MKLIYQEQFFHLNPCLMLILYTGGPLVAPLDLQIKSTISNLASYSIILYIPFYLPCFSSSLFPNILPFLSDSVYCATRIPYSLSLSKRTGIYHLYLELGISSKITLQYLILSFNVLLWLSSLF